MTGSVLGRQGKNSWECWQKTNCEMLCYLYLQTNRYGRLKWVMPVAYWYWKQTLLQSWYWNILRKANFNSLQTTFKRVPAELGCLQEGCVYSVWFLAVFCTALLPKERLYIIVVYLKKELVLWSLQFSNTFTANSFTQQVDVYCMPVLFLSNDELLLLCT